jgi:hypothetical protein
MQQQMKGAEHDSTIVQLQQAAVLPGDVPAGMQQRHEQVRRSSSSN